MGEQQPFFTAAQHDAVRYVASNPTDPALVTAVEQMAHLQKMLERRLFAAGSHLHPCWQTPGVSQGHSFATPNAVAALSIALARPRAEAITIERLMGRTSHTLAPDARLHPVLEVRLTPTHTVAEIIVSPMARWDQRNLVGKLHVERQCAAFRALVAHGGGGLRFGFWAGEDLAELYITADELLHGRVLKDWFGTFAAEHEWLRIGFWLDASRGALSGEGSQDWLIARVVLLSRLLAFFAWSSDNNFHPFIDVEADTDRQPARHS